MKTTSFLLPLGIFFIAFILSLIFLWIIRKYAPSWNLVDIPEDRKFHQRITPKGGGIAIVLSVVCAYFCGYFFMNPSQILWMQQGNSVSLHFWKDILIILSGGIAVFLIGLSDDFYNLRPWVKIFLESLVAFFLIAHNIRITLFIDNYAFSFVATWFWILLITNAFNLLDNMDGLSAGVAFISGLIFLVVAVQTDQWFIVFLLIGLLGSILGFLCYNFPPASIFMGDSGSLFIGYMMAVLIVHTTFYQHNSVFSLGLPVLVLAVPLFDTATVVFLRIREGLSIFQADKRHFSHRLVRLGMTPCQAVLTIYIITLATGINSLLLYQIDLAGAVIILIQIFLILMVLHILEQVGNR